LTSSSSSNEETDASSKEEAKGKRGRKEDKKSYNTTFFNYDNLPSSNVFTSIPMLGSNSRGLLDIEHGKMRRWVSKKLGSEGANNSVTGNKCTGFLSWGNPQRGLFIGVVRGMVTMFEQPPNHPIYTECTVTWALHSFHIPDYFT
jgi:hypothetical protein